jgi:hypothetical protein
MNKPQHPSKTTSPSTSVHKPQHPSKTTSLSTSVHKPQHPSKTPAPTSVRNPSMPVHVNRDTLLKHFTAPSVEGAIPFNKANSDSWEHIAQKNHVERGGLGGVATDINTLIVLTDAAWEKLEKGTLFEVSQELLLEKINDPTAKVPVRLDARDVEGEIETQKIERDYKSTCHFGGRAFAFEANFTQNGFEVNHFLF